MITTLHELVYHVICLPIWILALALLNTFSFWTLSSTTLQGAFLVAVAVWACTIYALAYTTKGLCDQHIEFEARSEDDGSRGTSNYDRFAIRSPTLHASISAELCSRCSSMLRNSRLLWGSWGMIVSAHETYVFDKTPLESAIARSSITPCQLCRLLYSTLQANQCINSEAGLLLPIHRYYNHGYGSMVTACNDAESRQPVLNIFEAVGSKGATQLQLTMPGFSSPAFSVFRGNTTLWHLEHQTNCASDLSRSNKSYSYEGSPNTGTKEVAHLARMWIDTCVKGHPECQKTATYRPRRLLKLLIADQVQLIDTASHPDVDFTYVALSHCWGPDGVPLRLTSATQHDLSTPFYSYVMPQNFRDAVSFTKALNYSYIWIDSLCIMQDSLNDTRSEILEMSEIYSTAACTIAATVSASPDGGCFRTRLPVYFTNLELLGSENSYDYIAPRLHEQSLRIEDFFAEEVETAALNQRAWTFQERLLSRRVIHFCKNVIAFECGNMSASEWHRDGIPYTKSEYVRLDGRLYSGEELQVLRANYPEYIDLETKESVRYPGRSRNTIIRRTSRIPNPEYTARQHERNLLLAYSARSGLRGALEMLQTLPDDLSQAEKLECHRRWYELVYAYSGRNTTYRSDRLRALAGLIELIGGKTGMINVEGLWETNLPFDLLWAPVASGPLHPEPALAPSWSWVSACGQVESLLTTFKAAHGDDDSGTITSQIHIETTVGHTVSSTLLDKNFCSIQNQPDSMGETQLSIRGPCVRDTCISPSNSQWRLDHQIDAVNVRADILLVYSEPSETDPGLVRWAGLLMQTVSDHDSAQVVYKRIGTIVVLSPPELMHDERWETRAFQII